MDLNREPANNKSFFRQSGFTLLELLISLVLISLIVTMLFGGLRLGSQGWERSDEHVERTDNIRLVREFIRRSLAQVRPVWYGDGKQKEILFQGDTEILEWVTPMSEHVGPGGLMLVRLSVTELDRKKQLVMTRWLYHPEILEGNSAVPAWEPLKEVGGSEKASAKGVFGKHTLIGDVETFEFSYFGRAQPGEEPDWHTEWEHPAKLPELVRMRLLGESEWWPDLVVSLVQAGRRHL